MAHSFRITRSGGDLATAIGAVGTTLSKAVAVGVAAAAEGAKTDLRKQLQGSGYRFGRAVNAVRSTVYPRPPAHSPSAAATVFAAGDSADRFLSAFATGAVVTPKRGRALAIPLHDFRGFDRRLVGPNSSFWGGRLIFIPAAGYDRAASGTSLGGAKIGILASKIDAYSTGARWSRNSRARRSFSRQLASSLIPQFLLVSVARMPKILSLDDVLNTWADRMPDLAARAAEILDA
ncbi:DUF6441 family protein [Limobrevibacterium gyesilva]|uniref:DUF6441 family protein n=1 Tax=Limobrevibacterium gyesilva TaxID=2991712 RepID=A0AA41YNX2_9PROT|nr:DUF6441 family protein [Limobrevibacterium gyesilva]MCW3477366.1 DUF6441 family protein [Limobrevibacterium gyesilva]